MLEKVKSKLNIVTFFIVFSAIWLTIMSFAVPISQTPDEFTHFINMMDLYGTPVYIHETTGTLYDDAELTTFNAEGVHPVNAEAYKKAGMQRYEHKLKITDFKPSVSAVKFLPAAIGFYLGVLLRLPKLVCLQMAELFSALFFIVLGAIALKKAPFKKEVFLFTMLMPMTIQQCSSFNPDVIVIACSVLLTAWILDMKFREGDVTWKDIIVLGLLSFEILIAKQIYVLLAASIIIVPFSKYKLPIGKKFDLAEIIKKYKFVFIGILILMIAAVLFVTRDFYYFKVLYACMLEPGRTLLLMRATISNLYTYYEQTFVGCFGWLDVYVSYNYITIFFIMMFYVGLFLKKEELDKYKQLKMWNRIVMVLIAVAISVFVFLSMATWSFELQGFDKYVDINTIRGYLFKITGLLGVQGRYFIPVIPMLLVPLGPGNELKNKKTFYIIQGLFYLFSMYYVTKLVMFRYWG